MHFLSLKGLLLTIGIILLFIISPIALGNNKYKDAKWPKWMFFIGIVLVAMILFSIEYSNRGGG